MHHQVLNARTFTHLAEIEVTMANSVYNVNEQSYVSICASRTGNIEGALPLDLVTTPGTADGKQKYTRVHRH